VSKKSLLRSAFNFSVDSVALATMGMALPRAANTDDEFSPARSSWYVGNAMVDFIASATAQCTAVARVSTHKRMVGILFVAGVRVCAFFAHYTSG